MLKNYVEKSGEIATFASKKLDVFVRESAILREDNVGGPFSSKTRTISHREARISNVGSQERLESPTKRRRRPEKLAEVPKFATFLHVHGAASPGIEPAEVEVPHGG